MEKVAIFWIADNSDNAGPIRLIRLLPISLSYLAPGPERQAASYLG